MVVETRLSRNPKLWEEKGGRMEAENSRSVPGVCLQLGEFFAAGYNMTYWKM